MSQTGFAKLQSLLPETRAIKQILNIADAPLQARQSPGGHFLCDHASLTGALGARKLGVSLTVVAPGNRAWPRHAHHVNEEMIYILDGEGSYHCGTETAAVKAADLVSAPPGDGRTAHQIENTSEAELRYLTFWTQLDPEVIEYPDSGKFGVISCLGGAKPALLFRGKPGDSAGYFDGEE